MTTTQRAGRVSLWLILVAFILAFGTLLGVSAGQYIINNNFLPARAGSVTFDNGRVDVTGVEIRGTAPETDAPPADVLTVGVPVADRETYAQRLQRLARAVRAHGHPCAAEDASEGPLPCYWSAGTAGVSFVALNGGVTADGVQHVIYVYADGHVERGGWGI